MKKAFMGLRLKRLREEQRLTQAALAQRLGISLSYLNQLENNQRPLTVQVLLALNTAFGLDLQMFSEDDEARLISDLREALSDAAFGETIAAVELRELAMNMPAVGRALVTIHRKYRQSIEQAGLLAARLGEDRQSDVPALPSTPYEEVRDFFYLRHNYIAELDEAAEAIAQAMNFPIGQMDTALAAISPSITASSSSSRRSTTCHRAMSGNSIPGPTRYISRRACSRASAPSSWERRSPCWRSIGN